MIQEGIRTVWMMINDKNNAWKMPKQKW